MIAYEPYSITVIIQGPFLCSRFRAFEGLGAEYDGPVSLDDDIRFSLTVGLNSLLSTVLFYL